jgi:hypothetical protein
VLLDINAKCLHASLYERVAFVALQTTRLQIIAILDALIATSALNMVATQTLT